MEPGAPLAAPEALAADPPRVPLITVLGEWGRIGAIGFGGPPAHIALLRKLVVEQRGWLDREEFEAAIAACNLLPGPASTQLAIFCAYRIAGRRGALAGGLAFITPAVVCVIVLSLLFLASAPPLWVRGAGDGAGSAVAAVAAAAALGLLIPSWHKARGVGRTREGWWLLYAAIGVAGAIVLGPYLVVALIACGLLELARKCHVGLPTVSTPRSSRSFQHSSSCSGRSGRSVASAHWSGKRSRSAPSPTAEAS